MDLKKAEEIASAIHEQYKKGSGVFQNHEIVDYEHPARMIAGSREHAVYLAYIFALDQDIESIELWRNARLFYQESPWFFDAEQILTRSEEGLTKALARIGVTKADSSIKKWRTLSKILLEKYSGDPRSIIANTRGLAEVRSKIMELLGTNDDRRVHRYLQLMSVNEPPKAKNSREVFADRNFPVFAIRTGVLKADGGMSEESLDDDLMLSLAGDAWSEVSAKLNIPARELEQLINIVSIRLCSQMKCIICPVYSQCDKKFDLKTDGKANLRTAKTDERHHLRFCTYCGRDISGGSRFCDGCGHQVRRQNDLSR